MICTDCLAEGPYALTKKGNEALWSALSGVTDQCSYMSRIPRRSTVGARALPYRMAGEDQDMIDQDAVEILVRGTFYDLPLFSFMLLRQENLMALVSYLYYADVREFQIEAGTPTTRQPRLIFRSRGIDPRRSAVSLGMETGAEVIVWYFVCPTYAKKEVNECRDSTRVPLCPEFTEPGLPSTPAEEVPLGAGPKTQWARSVVTRHRLCYICDHSSAPIDCMKCQRGVCAPCSVEVTDDPIGDYLLCTFCYKSKVD